MIVAIYLAAIVAANVSISLFGPAVAPVNAFLFIGLDLTLRDRLHDSWHNRGLVWKMPALVLTGAALSFVLADPRIALASGAAFLLAGLADAGTYALLGKRARALRVNGSNVVGAAVDSLVFPTLAFGALLPWVVLAQFVAKVGGGFVWYAILNWRQRVYAPR